MSKVYRSFLWTGSGDYHDFFGTAGIPCVSDRIPVKINEGLDCKKTEDTEHDKTADESDRAGGA